ncbi:ion transporter [Campylobacter sp. P0085]|uniref:ion transporter n=1 Tax=Campylobacter sp. P0085 TaxID=1895597 RepID=UPI000A353D99|nr:ion transporter [Campylobacter sp. P0085]
MSSIITLRSRLQSIIENKAWNYAIIAVILFNSLLLGLNTSTEIKASFGGLLNALDMLCLVIFTIELALRLFCYRLTFFTNKEKWWNIFDFLIVTLSFVAIEYSVLRTLRTLRILRLISSVPAMRVVVDAVLKTIPAMLSISALLSIFYYVYGVLCVELFGEKFPEWFGTLPRALYTLFQIMTLESWSMGIVRPVMEVYPYAWIVFVSYIVIVGMIALNLIVGVIVNSLNELNK